MAEVAVANKKRSILKGQMTNLRGALERGDLTPANIRLRSQRLTELFYQYEELHADLEDTEENSLILGEIQNSFYQLISSIAENPAAGEAGARRGNHDVSNLLAGLTNSTLIERPKSAKLPISELPKFDGNYHNWITFRNTFKSMIDSRTDIDDVAKFTYLRSSLTGAAANKLALFDASPENYKKGWEVLTKLYEKKRLLISKHYSAIFDNGYCKITPPSTASAEELSKLVDDAQQHKAMLESLKVVPDEGMIVSFLERALPADVKREWDRKLNSDQMPTFDEFYTFIHDHIAQLPSSRQDTGASRAGPSSKRSGGRQAQASKFRKNDAGNRALVTGTTSGCAYCKQNHRIYRCPEFEKLKLNQRWDAVRAKSLCRNCLGEHKGACKATHCKRCDKLHHTLLHNDSTNANKTRSDKAEDGNKA